MSIPLPHAHRRISRPRQLSPQVLEGATAPEWRRMLRHELARLAPNLGTYGPLSGNGDWVQLTVFGRYERPLPTRVAFELIWNLPDGLDAEGVRSAWREARAVWEVSAATSDETADETSAARLSAPPATPPADAGR